MSDPNSKTMNSCLPKPICLIALAGFAQAQALDLPLHPDEAKIIQAMVATEGIDAHVAEMPGWAKSGLIKTLEEQGVDGKSLQASSVASKTRPQIVLGFVFNNEGRILGLSGNGPWRNSTLRSFKALPELRILRMDHNGFVGNDPRIPEFDGSGFDALADSKLADISIGLSFSDKGMEQCAKIQSLRRFSVGHSQATEAGIAFFAGHAGLTSFSIAEMATQRVTGKALAAIAKIPNLTKVGFKECYVTYDGGFAHLAPLKGKLTEIDLSMSLARADDLAKLQADHPQAKIITLPPEEIVKRHGFIAANLAKQAPPELAAPLIAALENAKKRKSVP